MLLLELLIVTGNVGIGQLSTGLYFIPFVGPAIGAGLDELGSGIVVLSALIGAIQAAGVVFLSVGYTLRRRAPQPRPSLIRRSII